MLQVSGKAASSSTTLFGRPCAPLAPRGWGLARIVTGMGVAASLGVGFAAAPSSQPLDGRYLLTSALGEGVFDLSLTGETATFRTVGEAEGLTGRVDEAGRLTLPLPEGTLELTLPSVWLDPETPFSGTLGGAPVSFRPLAEYAFESVRQGAFIGVSVSYPVFSPPWQGVNERVRTSARAPMTRALDEGRALSRAGQLSYPWTHEETLGVTVYSAEVLSLLGTQFTYTGGAHPNTAYRALNFGRTPQGLRELELRDLFRPGVTYSDTLLKEVTRKLRARGAAWIVDGSVALTETDLNVFTLTRRGLEFAFAPYAVGPYAQGAFFVTAPYELLEDLLRPRFLP